jgi:glycosyltransferase involved in cell wall biosynthesis
MKILILYYELAAYNIICFEQLKGFEEVHIVAYPVNEEAPFTFNVSDKIKIHNRKDFDLASLQSLFNELQPAITFCAGWSDKDYLTIASNAKNSITVLGFDNQWTGNLKQRVGCLVKRRQFQQIFEYAFVPGTKQKEFANKLGFPDSKVMLGAYSCDYTYFNELGLKAKEDKKKNFPKRLLFVGRYISRKGIYNMWNAFIELQKEQPNDWELWCIGTGDEFENKIEHDKIKHFGFVQPSEMEYYIKNTGVFILPSHFEPWGVVTHEFAAAGFPLILSDKIGAGTKFLDNGYNGFLFSSNNVQELKQAMLNVINLSSDELLKMGIRSMEKAEEITPTKWAYTLMKLLND